MDSLKEQVTFISQTTWQLQLLAKSMSDTYLFLSPDFIVLAASAGYIERSNKPENQIINTSIFDLYQENDIIELKDKLKISLYNSITNKTRDDFAYSYLDQTSTRIVNISHIPVFDDKDRLLYITHRVSEIIDRVKSEDLFEKIVGISINGIMAYKAIRDINNTIIDFECIWANNASASFTGFGPGDVKGKRLSEIWANCNPTSIINNYADLVNNNLTLSYEKPYYIEDSQRWFHATSSKLDDGYAITFIDITERKRTEMDLIANKRKFEAVFNQTSYLVSIISLDGRLIESNNAALSVRGLSMEQIKGLYFWDLPTWKNRKTQLVEAIEAGNQGISTRFEVELNGKDEEAYFVDFSMKPILNEEGKAVFLIAEGRDITEKKRAEEELKKSRALLLEAEKIAHNGSWEWDIVDNKIYWSEELYRIFGYEPYAIENLNYETFLKHIHPEDVEHANKTIQASFNSREPFSFEHRIVQKNGEIKHLLGMGKVIAGENGQLLKMMGSTLDITKQTEVNQQILKNEGLYRTLAKNMPNAIVLLYDQELTITLADGAALANLALSKEMVIGRKLPEIYSEEKDYELLELFKKSLQGEEFALEKDVNGRIYKMEIMPVKNSVGEIFAGMAVFQDITDVKQYQKELEVRIDELNKSNEELEQFAYIASHDLQEPLRKIRAFGERLSGKFKDELGDDGKDYVDRMQNAASRMQILIDDLLAYSRLSRNKEEFKRVDLSETVNEVLNDLEITIEQKKAVINIEKLPAVMAIEGQMRQLFQNLVSNALKFSKPETSPQILIKAEIVQGKDVKEVNKIYKKNRYCRITVQDAGIGFDEKYLDRIFVIFQRLHGRSEYAGTGIGLAICKKIVENHNGFITAESKVNEGATFIITLPLSTQNNEQLYLHI